MRKFINYFSKGIFFGLVCSLALSFHFSNGEFMVVNKDAHLFHHLVMTHSEAFMIMVVFVCYGIGGVMIGLLNEVFENEINLLKANLLQMLQLYICIGFLAYVIGGLFTDVVSIIKYTVFFAGMYVVVYAFQYHQLKKQIEEMNRITINK